MWPLQLGARSPEGYARRYEHANCGLVAVFARSPSPGRQALERAFSALKGLSHRSGWVNGEGDGCGVLTDVPRALWARRLEQAGLDPALARQPWFAVAHLFIDREAASSGAAPPDAVLARVRAFLARQGIETLVAVTDGLDSAALGLRGRRLAPHFLQLGLWVKLDAGTALAQAPPFDGDGTLPSARRRAREAAGRRLFEATAGLERFVPGVRVVSMSAHSVVYKVLGDVQTLASAYADLRDPEFESRAVIGHNRYSTNTTPTFDRAQPFSLLAHNGEINTIWRLVAEAEQLGIPTVAGGSDSQNLNRTADALIHRWGFSLSEALEILFPPILNEVKRYPPLFQEYYMYFRQAWGPFAQGPAAILARHRHEAVIACDALGLRPMWQLPTKDHVIFASEPGIVLSEELVDDPRPLGPGEKVGVVLDEAGVIKVLPYPYLQERVLEGWRRKLGPLSGYARFIRAARAIELPERNGGESPSPVTDEALERLMAAWAWQADDVKMVEEMAEKGAEPIGSLGYDAPLAALSPELHNLADHFKESVAVVTNPAIDREREIEHFSTRVVLGCRPAPGAVEAAGDRPGRAVELRLPLLPGGSPEGSVLTLADARSAADAFETLAWDDLLAVLPSVVLPIRKRPDEPLPSAIDRICRMAAEAASSGVRLVGLDDRGVFEDADGAWIDPHLVLAAVDGTLRRAAGLRRRCGLAVRSGSLRNLHDVVLALGLGADAVNPWLMVELAARAAARTGQPPGEGVRRLLDALSKGIEKVLSTLGIHELRGYGRLFSCIGLKPELARLFEVEAYAASDRAGVGFRELEAQLDRRRAMASGSSPAPLVRPFRYWPRIWKALGAAARGEVPYAEVAARMQAIERENPVALRHVLALRTSGTRPAAAAPESVDISIGEHAMPFLISSMSFGSQGERAYRAYLEAAVRAGIVCLNGEGGEIRELVGRYPRHRGIQVASGRFGIHAEMLNGAWVIEIKIGQGAKPGEGGHLPGRKVSVKVAQARNATPGIDLISPSNNHDIYSIEDLAQLIYELRAVSPRSRIAVKVPVVPGIGTIAVGIVKAGADIVNLSGFDGGTGAARLHAIRHVGLPAEIGIVEAHRALVAAGLRESVEIWADGGMRSALDVMKCILLGANRVGFGTLAMLAIGCTACRGCQLDTCHVGIATQIESEQEAMARGLKRFVPRDVDRAAADLARLLEQMGAALQELTASLGARRTQDLVGRSDLLEQVALLDRVDLHELLEVARPAAASEATLSQRGAVPVAAGVTARAGARNAGAAGLSGGSTALQPRALGTPDAGRVARHRLGVRPSDGKGVTPAVRVEFRNGAAAAGGGTGAFSVEGVEIRIEGGAQDGAGKCSLGGRMVVLKGIGAGGRRVNGAVGKSFAYGAQRGRFFVQGEADSRAAIRLSGADVVFGAMPRAPVDDSRGSIVCTAQLKGFAFEYMTAGRVVVLGDPGPWICAGMTGGVVYLRLAPYLGLDEGALRRRLARGAKVRLLPVDERDEASIRELLGEYARHLRQSGQEAEALEVERLAGACRDHFVAVRPAAEQDAPHVTTE